MSLRPGTRLGPYELTAQIGAGGMGEVYRATDTRLDRAVAIKVLPESFARDADRVARFTREAKTLAALNHPNIAQVFGVEEQGATRALVMELVEGDDLAEIIARGPVAWAEALPSARKRVEEPGRSTRTRRISNSSGCLWISSITTSPPRLPRTRNGFESRCRSTGFSRS